MHDFAIGILLHLVVLLVGLAWALHRTRTANAAIDWQWLNGSSRLD